jgi:L-alanine-DL-glutamate epimerase-like enolase superfamily enzyme
VSSRPKGEIVTALADPKISRYARNDKYVTEFMKPSTKAAIDLACRDSAGKALDIPVFR